MPTARRIARIVTTPEPAPGFMGAGHTAVPVVDPGEFTQQDPFILLMDDRVDLEPGAPAGGAHPHAGFETVTLVLEGSVRDRIEGSLGTGDVQWMTAGSGVIHNEDVIPLGRTRILQLWLTLPHEARWTSPHVETIARADAPVRRAQGAEITVYSGSSGNLRAATHNFVPVTLVDISLDANASVEQELPSSYNGFVYVIHGSLRAGANDAALGAGQAGWLDRPASGVPSVLRLSAGDGSARAILYAGEPTNVPIVMHGPFVAESRADLLRISKDYIQGRLPRISDVHTGAHSG